MTNCRSRIVALVGLTALACGGDASSNGSNPSTPLSSAGPALLNANVLIGATVGSTIAYDATKGGTVFSDPAGAGLRYTIAFGGAANGLSAAGGLVTGSPSAPGVTTATLTAVDGSGRTVSDQFAIAVFASGLPAPVLPVLPLQYADAEVPFPAHFNAIVNGASVALTDNASAANPITDAGATLGRVLFYDPRLSANDGTSCASCHVQSLGFSDAPALSVGFAGALTARHAPGLANARFYQRGRFFWDERAATLEAQVVSPIQNAAEMGLTLDNLVLKLLATPFYKPLFSAAFGSSAITSDRVAMALAQYTRSLVSGGSRYDRAFNAAGVPNFASTLSAEEQAGEQLFRSAGCAACHTTAAQVADAPHNNGLDAVVTDTGVGRGAFKAPSLRNVGVRPRYMHDGRFTSLAEVVDFYDAGVKPSADLDPRLRAPGGAPKRLGLSTGQKAALVAFLNALTDSTFLTAARFSNPFGTTTLIPPVTVTNASVIIQGTAYHPPTVTVAPGTTITFTNLDNTRHSALFASTLITSTPIFTSGNRSVSMPSVAGTYDYHCAVHGAAMRGTVIVK